MLFSGKHDRRIIKLLEEIRHELQRIYRELQRARSLTYELSATPFEEDEGEGKMGQAVTLNVGQVGFGRVTEWSGPNGTGTPIPPPGPKGIIYASDNPAVATVDTNGNPTGVSAGTANLTALDQDNNLTDTSVCTVVGAGPTTAVSMTYDLSAAAFSARK